MALRKYIFNVLQQLVDSVIMIPLKSKKQNQNKQPKKAYNLLPKPLCTYSFQMPGTTVCISGLICRRIFSKCHIILFRHLFPLTDTFLLSSRTVFMLSIHRVSIGPSKITHLRSGVSDNANSLKVLAIIPSVH